MKPCPLCPHNDRCRVPGDLDRFRHVAHQLEHQHRAPALRERLHYYVNHNDCLVEAGYVDR